jgi:hypothetical protein
MDRPINQDVKAFKVRQSAKSLEIPLSVIMIYTTGEPLVQGGNGYKEIFCLVRVLNETSMSPKLINLGS